MKRCISILLGFTAALLLLACLFPGQSVAQEEEAALEEMVVTGTKFPTEAERIPGRVETITAEEIEDMPFQRVDELLQHISGVQTDRTRGIFELSPQVTMRGLGGDVPARTLVMIDGLPASIGDSGNFRWNRVNQANLERIEVLKGPGSSIYGSNAMGGVINIITKRPDKPWVADASVGYGSYNTKQGSARLGFQQEGPQGFFGQIAASGLDSDGYTAFTEDHSDYDARIDRWVEEFSLDTTLGYDFDNQNTLQLSHSYYDDERSEGYKYNLPDGGYREFDSNNLRLRYDGGAADWQWQVRGFYQIEEYHWHRDFEDPGSVYQVDSDREDYGVNTSVTTDWGERNTVTFGSDIRISSVDALDEEDLSDAFWHNEGQQDQYALYLQDETRFLDDQLILVTGLRYDRAKFHDGSYESNVDPFEDLSTDFDDNTWDAWSPRLSARYNFSPDKSVYASYSRGFRAPILDALCRHGIFHGRFYDANPELENETLDSFEIGGDLTLQDNLDLALSTYYSLGRDFIYSVDTGEERFLWGRDRTVYRNENVTKVEIRGLEFDMDYRLNDQLNFFANYNYNRSTIKEFDERPELESNKLEYVPEHSVSLGGKFLNPWVNAQVVLNHVGSQYTDDMNTEEISSYETVDLKLWRKLNFLHPKLTATLDVQNLFDERYLRSEDTKSPGLFALGELSYEF